MSTQKAKGIPSQTQALINADLVQAGQNTVDASETVDMQDPDFSHRLSPMGEINCALALVDTVSMMVNKSEAVLSMLSNAFAGDDKMVRPSDDVVFYSLKSIVMSLPILRR